MPHDNENLARNIETIKALAEESQALLEAPSLDVERLLAVMQAQSAVQQALLEALLGFVNPTDKEKDLSDTYRQAVDDMLDYFRERVLLAQKKADMAALDHLRKG